MDTSATLSRRKILRGTLGGAAISVGLPFLDCFLNTNGTALASGAPLPVRYGTWFWGLGLQPGRWAPDTTGAIKKLGPELAPLEPFKDKLNVYSGMKVPLDGRPLYVHFTGYIALLTGTTPRAQTVSLPTMDKVIADAIGTTTRFKSLEMSSGGGRGQTVSYGAGGSPQPSEQSPAALYARIFGADFVDPNRADFKPDPLLMAKQSVLSATEEQRQALLQTVGAADRARLDEYFTSVRQMEHQVALQLEKPPALESCSVPQAIQDGAPDNEVDAVLATNKLMAGLLAHALACNQTRVFTYSLTGGTSGLRFPGDSKNYHSHTHEDEVDAKLGYQVIPSKFAVKNMEGLAAFIDALNSVKEGDRTLLDRTVVMATTDTSEARLHAVDNMPMITIGSAGGALRTGQHIIARSDPTSRVALTVMQAMNVPISTWGTDSMQTSRPFTEVLV